MVTRQYRPGSRRFKRNEGRMSPNRLAWLRVYVGQFVIMRGYDEESLPDVAENDNDDEVSEVGRDIRLLLPRPTGRPITFNITALTHEELIEMKKFFNLLFDLAEPIILDRDRRAQDAFDQGDESFMRSYRQVPQFVVREGTNGADDQGVHERPEDLPSGDESGSGQVGVVRGSDGGVRGAGYELAPGESEPSEPQDDEPAAD